MCSSAAFTSNNVGAIVLALANSVFSTFCVSKTIFAPKFFASFVLSTVAGF